MGGSNGRIGALWRPQGISENSAAFIGCHIEKGNEAVCYSFGKKDIVY